MILPLNHRFESLRTSLHQFPTSLGSNAGTVSKRFYPISKLKLADTKLLKERNGVSWETMFESTPEDEDHDEETSLLERGVCVPAGALSVMDVGAMCVSV